MIRTSLIFICAALFGFTMTAPFTPALEQAAQNWVERELGR